MAKTTSMTALTKLKEMVSANLSMWRIESLSKAAEIELREEQVRQQELANMIAMLANPSACPFPSKDVLARIKELSNIGEDA